MNHHLRKTPLVFIGERHDCGIGQHAACHRRGEVIILLQLVILGLITHTQRQAVAVAKLVAGTYHVKDTHLKGFPGLAMELTLSIGVSPTQIETTDKHFKIPFNFFTVVVLFLVQDYSIAAIAALGLGALDISVLVVLNSIIIRCDLGYFIIKKNNKILLF